MDDTIKLGITLLISVVYVIVYLVVSFHFGNRQRLKEINSEIKQLNQTMNAVAKKGDEKKLAQIEAEFVKLTNEMLVITLKSVVISIVVFVVFMWLLNTLVPSTRDDIEATVSVVNGTFTYTFPVRDGHPGVWRVEVITEDSINHTTFFVEKEIQGDPLYEDYFAWKRKGPLTIKADKELYRYGETVTIEGTHVSGQSARITVDKGTRFFVRLPLSLPTGDYASGFAVFFGSIFILSLVFAPLIEKVIFEKKPSQNGVRT